MEDVEKVPEMQLGLVDENKLIYVVYDRIFVRFDKK